VSVLAATSALFEVVREIGESDCEELGTGFLAQPVNALTSLAYVVVGGITLGIAVRHRHPSLETWVFAVLLAAVGLGSVAFHGPQPGGARVMHDLPILLLVVFIIAHDVKVLRPRGPSAWAYFVPAAVLSTGVMLVSVDVGAAFTGAGVVTVAVLEFVIYRRRLRPLDDSRRRRSAVMIIAVSAVAGATWLLGRTDSPACDPDGILQVHGLWHVLSAVVFGLWWWLALDVGVRRADNATSERRSPAAR